MNHRVDESEIGALWEKTGANGQFFSGKVDGVSVVVFKNGRKAAGSKAPDWRVFKAKPKPTTTSEDNW